VSVERTASTLQIREDGNTPQKLPTDDAGPSWQSRCINQ
jgi:epsilon-lactone hydrolase